jgi:hypothetical protein
LMSLPSLGSQSWEPQANQNLGVTTLGSQKISSFYREHVFDTCHHMLIKRRIVLASSLEDKLLQLTAKNKF